MGMRVRPIREMGLDQEVSSERVQCWNCQTRFVVLRTITRATCPKCGSRVAMHRLKMPMMPSSGTTEEVIRLQEEMRDGKKAHDRITSKRSEDRWKRVRTLQNGEPVAILLQESQPAPSSPEKIQFEARSRIEERRKEMFEDAEPRMDGVLDGPQTGVVWLKMLTLVASIAVVVILGLLTLVFALRGG